MGTANKIDGSGPSLKDACKAHFATGVALGTLEGYSEAERDLIRRHFSRITPENCMKAKAIHPEEHRYAFEPGDRLTTWAEEHGMKMNAHALVWHSACPEWIFRDGAGPASKALVLDRMHRHIEAVAGHARGRVESWDVVNEAVSDLDGEWLRKSPWFETCGVDFLIEAFRWAQQADPGARLIYNDYNIEFEPKRSKTLRLLDTLADAGVRVDGVGLQGHYVLSSPGSKATWVLGQGDPGTPIDSIEEGLCAFGERGLSVSFSELDVDPVPRKTAGASVEARETGGDDPWAQGLSSDMQRRLAEDYRSLFTLFRRKSSFIDRVTFWGLHDGRTWLNDWPRKRTNHPLLWDRQGVAKPAFQAVIEAMIA